MIFNLLKIQYTCNKKRKKKVVGYRLLCDWLVSSDINIVALIILINTITIVLHLCLSNMHILINVL